MGTRGELIVRFWGVRGSYPAPGSETARYGGNTSCVEVEVNGSTIILDSGTGIVSLGRSLVRRAREQGRKVSALLLFSHLHHDHTQGFPFFSPAYIPGSNLWIYGPELLQSNPLKTVEEVMQPPYFPVRLADLNANLTFGTLRDRDVILVGEAGEQPRICRFSEAPDSPDIARVTVLRSQAHPGGVLHYRIDFGGRSIVYATDTEGYVNTDRRLSDLARGADLMIHDAQYTDEHYLGLTPGMPTTQGYGHSTVSMACQAAHVSDVKQLALFHHAPEYDDNRLDEIGGIARMLFPQAFVASEGLEMRFAAVEGEAVSIEGLEPPGMPVKL